MASDEQYVRERWDSVSAGPDIYGYGITLPTRPTMNFVGFQKKSAGWQTARAFTEQREREIREVEEEIDLVEMFTRMVDWAAWHTTGKRTLTRLQAVLDDLKKGMRDGK